MTQNKNMPIFLDEEQDAFWYLGSQRIITALGEHNKDGLHFTEFVMPAGTLVYAHLHRNEDEAYYVIEGEATISCGKQLFPVRAGTFLSLPCNIPHHMEISKSGPFRYLTWMTSPSFIHDVLKVGEPDQPFFLQPPLTSNRGKIQQLANQFRACSTKK